MKFSNIKALKSTVLGLGFIGVGLYLLINSITTDYYIVGGLLIVGLSLFFTGDKIIHRLEKFVFGRVLFPEKPDKDEQA